MGQAGGLLVPHQYAWRCGHGAIIINSTTTSTIRHTAVVMSNAAYPCRQPQTLPASIKMKTRIRRISTSGTTPPLYRRQVFRLCRVFEASGASGLISRKRGRASNRKRGETFRHTVLALIREHYPDFGPTLAMEKLVARHGLRVGVETLRQWMMADGLWIDRRHRGHHTIRPKSHAKGPFRWPLPLESVLKEGFERKIPRICRSRAIHAQTTVFESR